MASVIRQRTIDLRLQRKSRIARTSFFCKAVRQFVLQKETGNSLECGLHNPHLVSQEEAMPIRIQGTNALEIARVQTMSKLNLKAWLSLAIMAAVMAGVLFLLAGTLQYWQGWVYLGVYSGAAVLITLYLMIKDPALLQRRMRGGPTAEKHTAQKIVMLFASAAFIAIIVVPALDYRFGWSSVPLYLEIIGNALTALGFFITFLVFRVNTFTSATVEIAENQRVITTGPYALVRHPMYFGGLLIFIGTPLALGSYWGLLAFVAALPALIWRLLDEEKLLVKSLPGYVEYKQRVRYRLIPLVW
jgi:protein-S-isoprenylcysteine O-methyltransferase Ste14